MSRGELGDFADDPDSVFVDVPPNPTWITLTDLSISGVAVLATFITAKHFGARGVLATVLAVAMAPVAGFKLSFFARKWRTPRFNVDEFDAVRRAGSLALVQFRQANPEHAKVGWSLVASPPEGKVIGCMGRRDRRPPMDPVTVCVYLVSADGALCEESRVSHPLGGYSQRIRRCECSDARLGA